MNFLKEQHREWLNNINLLGSGLLVYMGAEVAAQTEVAPGGTARVEVEIQIDPGKKLEESVNNLDSTRQKTESKYKEGGFSAEELRALSTFKGKMESIQKDFDTKIKGVEKPEETTIKAIQADVDALLARMNAAEAPTEPQNDKDKLIDDPANLPTLAKALGASLGVQLDMGNPDTKELVRAALSQVDQAKLEKALQPNGKLELGDAEINTIRTEILGRLINRSEGIEPGEEQMVASLDLAGAPEGGLKKGTELNRLISLKYKVTKGEGDKILLNGKEPDWSEISATLHLEGTTAEGTPQTPEELAKNKMKAEKTLRLLEQAMTSDKAAEKMGPFESLAALIQLFQSLKAAIQSGDWQTLSDTLQDFNEGKNPAESMKQSRSAYEKALEGKKDAPLDKLLTAYMDPRGKEADALLLANAPEDQKSALSRYRMEARPTIQNHIQKELGLGMISNITKVNDRVQIDAFDEGSKHHFVVESFSVGGQQQVEVRPFSEETVTENNQQVKKEVLTAKDKAIKIPTEGGKAPTMAEIRNFIKDWDKNIKVAAPARPGEKKETVKKPKFTEDQLKKMGTKALKTEIDGAIKANPQLATAEDYTKMEQLKSGKDWGKDGDRTKAQKTLDDARRQWIFKNVTV